MTGETVRCYSEGRVGCGCHCDIYLYGTWCGEPAASCWDFGCVHEHVRRWAGICAGHEQYIASMHGSCDNCLAGAQSHDCEVTFRAIPEPVTRRHLTVVTR